jgi:putative phosphonate metabolism protein
MGDAGPRYAIYYAPGPDTQLWRFGSSVLAYDAYTGAALPPLAIGALTPERQVSATEDPRRYGFHATLKAPFHLATSLQEADLLSAAGAFAANTAPALLDGLQVALLHRFVAVVPNGDTGAISLLAAACVEAFEPFRAPLSDADLKRRDPDRLPARQREYLLRWGYPHVFEDFRFHMTLTGPLEEPEREPVTDALTRLFADHVAPDAHSVDRIAVYKQADRQGRFQILETFMLRGSVRTRREMPLWSPRSLDL